MEEELCEAGRMNGVGRAQGVGSQGVAPSFQEMASSVDSEGGQRSADTVDTEFPEDGPVELLSPDRASCPFCPFLGNGLPSAPN